MPTRKNAPSRRSAAVTHARDERILLDREVREIMSTGILSIRHEISIADAAKRLVEMKVHGAPVVDTSGRLVGLVSQTDLLAWYSGIAAAPRAAGHGTAGSVRDIMTPYAHAVRPDTLVSTAAALMIRRRIHRLMVVDEDLAPVGIVTAFDVLRTVPGVSDLLAKNLHD